ncbi:hypothetical protein PoB_007419300 [Plakobranchus ocellatus]|uniref:Uncharacterized protein n=1 Tax=Plakobranchus ocellatus TaxID=259542 RepID=A0AAV4DTR0_9GAST|nr:hypothetical protein PoB_007419300 [Plakobranchus ocellatus]
MQQMSTEKNSELNKIATSSMELFNLIQGCAALRRESRELRSRSTKEKDFSLVSTKKPPKGRLGGSNMHNQHSRYEDRETIVFSSGDNQVTRRERTERIKSKHILV